MDYNSSTCSSLNNSLNQWSDYDSISTYSDESVSYVLFNCCSKSNEVTNT